MSHYAVAVIHRKDQDIEELLAPFDENLQVEKYVEYTRQEAIDYARKHYKTDKMSDQECWKMLADDAGEGMTDSEGNIYSTYNPQSKWDWWTEGGRWSGMLKLKNGGTADSARIGDIDFTPDEGTYEQSLRFWDVVVDHQPEKDGEDYFSIYNEQYYREFYGDRETFARQQAAFSTYAVLTPDGTWNAPGNMGWWGVSSESGEESRKWYDQYMDRFIANADPDLILTIADCHI